MPNTDTHRAGCAERRSPCAESHVMDSAICIGIPLICHRQPAASAHSAVGRQRCLAAQKCTMPLLYNTWQGSAAEACARCRYWILSYCHSAGGPAGRVWVWDGWDAGRETVTDVLVGRWGGLISYRLPAAAAACCARRSSGAAIHLCTARPHVARDAGAVAEVLVSMRPVRRMHECARKRTLSSGWGIRCHPTGPHPWLVTACVLT